MFGRAGDAMPHIGRLEPELKDQYAIHLTKVRGGQARLRFAIWIPTKQKWVTYANKNDALERSIKANGDDPNWQSPSEFYMEGYTLSLDKENVPVSQRTAGTGNWCDLACESSPRHPMNPSRRSRKTKSTGSSSGASSASSGPPSDPAERKVRAALPCPALPCPATIATQLATPPAGASAHLCACRMPRSTRSRRR